MLSQRRRAPRRGQLDVHGTGSDVNELNCALLVFLCEKVWQMLAAVLHMSTLRFDVTETEQGDIASISDREVRGMR